MKTIIANQLHSILRGSEEVALLDVRDGVDLIENGAILLAAHLPIGEIQSRVSLLVPRRTTPVVLVDDEGGILARRAAAILARLGYRDVAALHGGVQAWGQAGYTLYNSSYIFGLAFATFLEKVRPTPHVEAEELAEWLTRPDAPIMLDTRSDKEFAVRSIPGALQATGADTVRLALSALAEPERPVVVNCAGYTRSITAAQGLIHAGLPNPVHILRDGTKAWQLAGLPFDTGARNPVPDAGPHPLHAEAAARLRERFGIGLVDAREVQRLVAEHESRNVYLLDIRSAGEVGKAPAPAFRSVPHETIWPWTVRHIGVLRSRVILADAGEALRAISIAAWLKQQGWDDVSVHPLEEGSKDIRIEDVAPERQGDRPDIRLVRTDEFQAPDVVLADISPSPVYAAGHIPGARLVSQARLPELVAAYRGRRIVVTAPTQRQAEEAVLDIAPFAAANLSVLSGGNADWTATGKPQATGLADAFGPVTDVLAEKWDAPDWREKFLALIEWEHTLPEQIATDTTLPFRFYP